MINMKVHGRTIALIRNGVTTGQRSIFVITGDEPHDQIARLYSIFDEEQDNRGLASKGVLWCYGDKLVLPRRKINMAKQLSSLRRYGVFAPAKGLQFSLFIKNTPIMSCRYNDSERILGNTFDMCVFQDFEALTSNLLATTIETVDVGGLVILLKPSSSNVRDIIHEGLPTDFILSLASCRQYIVMNDELKVLPISSQPQPQQPCARTTIEQLHKDVRGLDQDFARLMSQRYINPLYQHPADPYTASASASCPYGTMDTDP
ncbi:hypothetical protein L1887_07713 [Cichorium endivia]|nr:hypothetical protein L1887_07713 [Cichorium endivia]